MRKVLTVGTGAVAAFALWAGQASAVNSPDFDIPYVAAQYLHEIGDSARDSDDGQGYQLTLGVPLSWEKSALEITFSDLGRDRNLDGNKDYQTALLVDFVRDFGLFGWETQYLPKFKPFALAGLGAIQEDVRGDKHLHVGGNVGAGLLFPTNFYGIAFRTEARVLAQDNSKSVPGEDFLIDYRLTAGLQLPLTPFFDTGAKVAPAADCSLAVVDPATGRSDCSADSDRDGVADVADECPGTPSGTIVNTKGCPVSEGAVLRGVEFNTGSAELTEASKGILDNAVATLSAPNTSIVVLEVAGHTDAVGNEPYNLMLSEQRAESVRQYLIGKGVPADNLQAHGYGKTQPVASNNTASGRAENRRVEFKIVIEK